MKLHIFVATTQGLVAIQNITAIDDADISSIVSINGTSTTANISSAYHNFVINGAGILQQDFGACSYRINIAERIDQGNSWQLAFYLAHAAHKKAILGDGKVKPGDQVICATGEVNTTSREIHRVAQVALKLRLATEQIQQWQKMNVNTSFLVPKQNAEDISDKLTRTTELITNLEQALSFLPLHKLPSHTLPESKAAPQTPNSLKPQKQNVNSDITKSEDTESEGTKSKGTKLKTDIESEKSKISKNKLTYMRFFIGLLGFVVLALLFKVLFLSQNDLSLTASKNTEQQILSQQTSSQAKPIEQNWQVILLTKPQHEVSKQLQPAYSMIEKTIGEQLIAGNFEITDKKLLMGASKITEQALIELNKHDINLAIRFNLNVNKLNDEPRDTWKYLLSASVIDVESKKQIDTHNEYGEFSNDFINCDQQCLSQWFAENARKLAQDMGAILAIKLKNLPRRYQFELNFQHFLADELRLMETQLHKINGFKSLYLLQDFGIEKELLHETASRKYAYISHIPLHEFEVQLYKSFTRLNINAIKTVAYSNTNTNTLIFNRKYMPYYVYYLLAGVLILSLLLLAFLITVKRQHNNELKRLANGLHAQRWLTYYDKISPLFFIKESEWPAQKTTYINHVELSKSLSDKALQYVEMADYNKLHVTLEEALKLNADNTDAKNLKAQLAGFIEGEKQFLSGQSIINTQPEQALKLLIAAKNSNANLGENLDGILGESVNESLMAASFKVVLIAFKNKEYYKAYSLIDRYIHYPSSIEIDNEKLKKLIEIRNNIAQYIQPIKGAVVGQIGLENCYIFTSTTLEVGRNVNNSSNSLSIGYKQISRVGKQCKISREEDKFYIEDQGSTNGSFFNNRPLKTHQKVSITDNAHLTLGGGENTNNIAICQLELKVLPEKSSTLMMQLNSSVTQFVDLHNTKTVWGTMETDLVSRWILLGKEVSLSINNERIELGHNADQADIIAYLIYQNGFYIRPAQPFDNSTVDSSNKQLMINQQVIYDKMPINESAVVTLNGFDFSLRSLIIF